MSPLDTTANQTAQFASEPEFEASYLDADVPPPRRRAMNRLTWALLFVLTAAGGFWEVNTAAHIDWPQQSRVVELVDNDGKLLLDDPKVREGLIKALTDYVEPYQKGCTPPSSTTWKDPDNNVAFHNKTTVMTHNFTISIAAKWYEDSVNQNATPEQREAGRKAYEDTIITAPFPMTVTSPPSMVAGSWASESLP